MQTAEFSLSSSRGKVLSLASVSHTDLQQIYRMSWQVLVLVKAAPRMGWMKSFSTLSCFTFDHGVQCTEREREPETLPDLQGKGSRKRVANQVPKPK